MRLARFHRVQGLISHSVASLGTVPADLRATLFDDARVIASSNLRAAAESLDILSDFETAGIPLLFLKGLTLGARVYSKPLLKMGWDIDLLVAPDDVVAAGKILLRRGYRLVLPRNAAKLERWHQRRKESVWANHAGMYVELHTRLADNPELIGDIDVKSPARSVEVARDIRLPTFEDDELFAYLCAHGASSAWFRLKWITDFAGLIHSKPPSEIERLYKRSQQLRAYRAADQALLLADALYGSLEGTDLKQRLLRDRTSRILFNAALRQVSIAEEPMEVTFGTWLIHWTQLLLKPGLAFKISEVSRQIRDAIS